MQYIQLQPQILSSVPDSTIGSVHFFIDSNDNLPKTKDSSGNVTNLSLITVTKDEADILISNNNLFINQIYKITGVMKNKPNFISPLLYDDGTNSGISLYLTAISTSKFNSNGYGEFYNPKYLSYDTYGNRDKTGLYGIWDGENPSSIATYSIGDVAIWGGYAWVNLSGDVGTNPDATTLNSDWQKIQYTSTTNYHKVIDYIEYDYDTDWLVRRKDIQNNIDVITPFETYWANIDNKHPISVTQWGNSTPYSAITGNSYNIGLSNVFINDAYFETINFKGKHIYNLITTNTFSTQSYFGYRTILENVTCNDSYFSNISLYYDWVNENDSYFGSNEINNSYSWGISLSGSTFQANVIYGSGVFDLNLTNYSLVQNNEIINSSFNGVALSSSQINYNCLKNGSGIEANNIIDSNIGYNQLFDSSISSNNISASTIDYNILTNSSAIQNNQNGIINSEISNNTLNNNSNIQNIQVGGISNFGIINNELNNSSVIDSIWGTDSYIQYNIINKGGAIQYFQFDSSSHIDNNTIDGGKISGAYYQDSILSNSLINYNSLNEVSNIRDISLTGSSIQYNTLSCYSYIGYLYNMIDSSINHNSLNENSGIEGLLMNTGFILNNTINGGSYIGDGSILSNNSLLHFSTFNNSYFYVSFDSSEVVNSIFKNAQFEPSQGSGPITSKTIQKIEFKDATVNQDINTATTIFDSTFSKNVFIRLDGTPRLSYYDDTDTIVITDITA